MTAAVPLLLLPILTRELSPSEYGEVILFQLTVAAFSIFIGLSTDAAAIKNYLSSNNSGKNHGKFLVSCVQVVLLSSMLCILFCINMKTPLANILGIDESWIFMAILVSTSTSVVQLLLSQLQANQESIKYFLFQSLQSLMSISLAIIFVVGYEKGAEGRVVAQVIVGIVLCVATLAWLRARAAVPISSFEYNNIKKLILFGAPLIFHSAGLFIIGYGDRIVLNNTLSTSELGIYAVASQISAVIAILFDAINKVAVPQIYKNLEENINKKSTKKLTKSVKYIYYLAVVAALCGFVIGPFGVEIIAGPDFRYASSMIGWLILGQCFYGVYLAQVNNLFYFEKTKQIALATFSSSIIHMVVLYVLVENYGLRGAGVAFALSMGLRLLIVWILVKKLKLI